MAHFSLEFYVKSLARKTKLDLVIPSMNLHESLANKEDDHYCNSEVKYPLLICLHGFGDTEKSFQNNTSVISLCEQYKVACCFVNGENKWYLNMGPIDDFYSLVERDITDFLYGNFRTLSKEMPLGICGVSMGGYGAMYHYLKNPEKYYCAICLSPATKPDFIDESKYGSLRDLALAAKGKTLSVYLSVGTKDFIIDASKDLDKYLVDNEIGFHYRYVENADHSWKTWNKEMENVFDYLKQIKFIK